jgi:hypothetical protein
LRRRRPVIEITPQFVSRLKADTIAFAQAHPESVYVVDDDAGEQPDYLAGQVSGVPEKGCTLGVVLQRQGYSQGDVESFHSIQAILDKVTYAPETTMPMLYDLQWLGEFQDAQDSGTPLAAALAQATAENPPTPQEDDDDEEA